MKDPQGRCINPDAVGAQIWETAEKHFLHDSFGANWFTFSVPLLAMLPIASNSKSFWKGLKNHLSHMSQEWCLLASLEFLYASYIASNLLQHIQYIIYIYYVLLYMCVLSPKGDFCSLKRDIRKGVFSSSKAPSALSWPRTRWTLRAPCNFARCSSEASVRESDYDWKLEKLWGS